MAASGLRDREDVALDLVGVAGLTAVAAGLVLLAPSDALGFDLEAAIAGVAGQLGTTLPAALLMLAATALDLAAGFTVARSARRLPFGSLGEGLLWAAVATVLKNAALLGLLGALGLFRAPVLLAVNAALVTPLVLQLARATRADGGMDWRARIPALGSLPLVGLVVVVWSGPLVLQLASPVVPFLDVLPNHVAPAEHLRAFGAFDPLTATQSPIYGPSRTLLGYVGWLGALTTMTGLPAGLAISAFILPSTILVAVGVVHLARALAGPGVPVGPWVLLAFALTTPFARLADVRGTVLVLPLACAALALVADVLARGRSNADTGPRTAAPDPWWPGSGTLAGLALGGSILVHPVVGALTAATVGLVALARPAAMAGPGTVAIATASIVALPQAAAMAGLALPAPALALAIAGAGAVGAWLERLLQRPRLEALLETKVRWLPMILTAVVGAMLVILLLTFPEVLEGLGPAGLGVAGGLVLDSIALLLVVLVAGWVLGSPAARSPIVLLAAAAGVATALATQLVPGDIGLLGRALRFELPKTLHYWIPVAVAVGAGATLALVQVSPRLRWPWRHVLLGLFVAAAALPIRPEPISTFHLGERRWPEALAFDLRYAGRGFWSGHPDRRLILDEPRREIVEAVRGEIAAGRLGPTTGVLHIAASFQQWDATPLGVFAGVTETTVSPDAEFSIHTVGGRLHRLDDLDTLLASGLFAYVLLEPSDLLPDDVPARIRAAGLRSIFANVRGELFRLEAMPAG